ncbi:MAG: hypothetical protein ABIG20_03790 [archaeon]
MGQDKSSEYVPRDRKVVKSWSTFLNALKGKITRDRANEILKNLDLETLINAFEGHFGDTPNLIRFYFFKVHSEDVLWAVKPNEFLKHFNANDTIKEHGLKLDSTVPMHNALANRSFKSMQHVSWSNIIEEVIGTNYTIGSSGGKGNRPIFYDTNEIYLRVLKEGECFDSPRVKYYRRSHDINRKVTVDGGNRYYKTHIADQIGNDYIELTKFGRELMDTLVSEEFTEKWDAWQKYRIPFKARITSPKKKRPWDT